MKKLILIFVLLLTIPTFAATDQSREVLPDFSEASLPVLNDILNNIRDTTKASYPLSIANGGTGSATKNFVDLTTAQSVGGVKSFTSFPATPSSAPTTDYQVANKKYVDDSVGGVSATGNSNVIFASTPPAVSNAGANYIANPSWSSAGTTGQNDYYQVLDQKWIKIAGVNTITYYAKLQQTGSDTNSKTGVRCTFGSLSSYVLSSSGDFDKVWYSGTLDVSSLTNGTAYAVRFDLYHNNGDNSADKMYQFTIMGS